MCWTSKTAEKLTAIEDIPILKVCVEHIITKEITSYYYGSEYKLNEFYKSKIERHCTNGATLIDVGLHCYSSKCQFKKLGRTKGIGLFSTTPPAVIIRKFHDDPFHCVIVLEGFIPMGATYYINEIDEIVTNHLVLTNVLDI